jgi:phosphohistidine phosphatase SixA
MPPDVVLCSTATRADETAQHALASAYLTPTVMRLDELYESDVARHVEAIRHADESGCASCERLLIVGHNPTLQGFVSQLVSRPVTMRTGALAVVALNIQHWGEIEVSSRGLLVGLFDPEMLKKKARVGLLT